MKKTVGSSAGIVAVIALLVHTLGNTGPDHPSSLNASSQQSMPGLDAFPAGEKSKQLAVVPQGPWRATQQYFHSAPRLTSRSYDACLLQPAYACLQRIYAFPASLDLKTVHSVIATVPDPLHTRMAMETDRYLDALRQAAFDSGYELASQWLPWTVKAAAEKTGTGSADSRSFDWEKLPGLLVFRPHYIPYLKQVDSLLLVFVVGETPTAGLNEFQFEQARSTISSLDSGQRHNLYIVGPNFSGSLSSLARLLEESARTTHIELRTGSVSNSEYVREMLIHLRSHGFQIDPKDDSVPSITFHASTLPNASFHEHFMRIAARIRLEPEQLAEITEDETGFSYKHESQQRHENQTPITYRYPRDIAQLRNTYNDAAFASAQPETKATPPVEFSLKDTQTGEDSFPIFSTSHTPISQNAILQEIANHLRHSSIRLVSLSASNVFDTVFLANVFARNCPDIRVVVPSADLLFVQEAATGSLSGLMAISPFPLFPEGTEISQRMAPEAPPDLTTFATSDQIGEFNAVLSLLALFGPDQTQTYRRKMGPAANNDFASAWLLILSSRGWMPVDLFGQDNRELEVANHHFKWFDPTLCAPKNQKALGGLLEIGPGWTTLCVFVAAFSLAFFGRLVCLMAQPHKRVWSALCVSDLALTGGTNKVPILRDRYFCMVSCFASLAAINGLLLCPVLVFWTDGGKVIGVRHGAPALIVTAVGAAFLCCLMVSIGLTLAQKPRSWPVIGLRASAIALALGTVYIWWTCCTSGVSGYMFCFRTLTLAFPVSPICPLLLASSGLFALSYFHLRRFTWGHRRLPYLDTSVFDAALCNEFQQIKSRLDYALVTSFGEGGLTGVFILTSVAAMLGLSLWWLLPYGSLSTFERPRFSLLVRLLFAPLAFYTLVSLVRFSWAWALLRAFLVNLNSVVLGRYFMRIPEFGGGGGPVWIRGVKLMSLGTAVNSAIALHNLEIIQNKPGEYANNYVSKLQDFLAPSDKKTTRQDFIHAYEQFRKTANDIATELAEKVLRKYWLNNELPFVGGPESDSEKESSHNADTEAHNSLAEPVSGDTIELKSLTAAVGRVQSFYLESHTARTQVESAPTVKDEFHSAAAYEQASKFVALHYSAYIGYALHQLQNLLVCSVTCFVLLVLALNSFSFQAPQAIFHLMSVGLIVGGVAVLIAFAQMERDPILSRLSGTAEGELGKAFYVRALTFGAVPVLTVLITEFPTISRYLTGWIEPVSAALQ